MRRFSSCSLTLLLCLWIAGCAYDTGTVPQSRQAIQQYRVERGETLYSIAWRYNLDFRQLAYWNKIPPPYRIFPGQRIYMNPPPGLGSRPPPNRTTTKPPPLAAKPDAANRLPRDVPEVRLPRPDHKPAAPAPPPRSRNEWIANKDLRWRWPTKGRVLRRFSMSAVGKQGLDISGKPGQSVFASEGGKVVYSGNGLKGYGELVIIKHNETFLSAYAHNRRRLVSEGAIVQPGQQIAELGNSGAKTPMLHFEIRQNGRPVDPMKFLPRTEGAL